MSAKEREKVSKVSAANFIRRSIIKRGGATLIKNLEKKILTPFWDSQKLTIELIKYLFKRTLKRLKWNLCMVKLFLLEMTFIYRICPNAKTFQHSHSYLVSPTNNRCSLCVNSKNASIHHGDNIVFLNICGCIIKRRSLFASSKVAVEPSYRNQT